MKTLLLITTFILSSCATYHIPKYPISDDNVEALKKLNLKVKVAPIEWTLLETHSYIPCRSSSIDAPDGTTFEGYIQKALESELQRAGMLDPNGKELKIVFAKISANTMGTATWILESKMNFDHKSVELEITNMFKNYLANDEACTQAAHNFTSVVQAYIKGVIDNLKRMEEAGSGKKS